MWLTGRDIGTFIFHMTAIFEIKDGRLLPSRGSGSPSQMKAMVMESTWTFFVRHVPIILLSDLTIIVEGLIVFLIRHLPLLPIQPFLRVMSITNQHLIFI